MADYLRLVARNGVPIRKVVLIKGVNVRDMMPKKAFNIRIGKIK